MITLEPIPRSNLTKNIQNLMTNMTKGHVKFSEFIWIFITVNSNIYILNSI